jgi:hypothetical protein
MTSTTALRIVGRLATALAVLVPAAFNTLIQLFASGMQCDDSCEAFSPADAAGRGVPWRDTAGAWQWSAIGWLGFASFVCALACAVGILAGRRRVSLALFSLACLTGLIPWVIAAG